MWEISLNGQISTFLYSIALGAALALLYDFIRAIRDMCFNSFAVVFICDLLFFLVSAVAVFIYFMGATNGEIRGYVLFSAAVGFFICRITLGRVFHFFVYRFLRFCSFVMKLLSNCLLKIIKLCAMPVRFITKRISALCRFIIVALKKVLKNIYNMLYTIKDKKKSRYYADEQRR
ncbi:MAG: spore cortex biosynthesis protein YabQ [Clostridia bacterium]|nr:spore cortex biosynthesis protein YabQ [Clostridia bacterium]